MEDAIIALKQGRLDEAGSLLNAGIEFWKREAGRESMDSRNDYARMLLYRALILESYNRKAEAISDLDKVLAMFPQRRGIRNRVEELNSGTQPSLLASGAWNDILNSEIEEKREHTCNYDSESHVH